MKLMINVPSDCVNNNCVQAAAARLREDYNLMGMLSYKLVNNIKAWCETVRPGSGDEVMVGLLPG